MPTASSESRDGQAEPSTGPLTPSAVNTSSANALARRDSIVSVMPRDAPNGGGTRSREAPGMAK
ncbi:hypothetical protein [Ralstonia condita]|uniref:hypothetical protein n=1 Tax=Ralstonia condita TaxID=3058600 RepID=UPI00292F1F18|nr:hypothetical protein [Ralstonia sp. LMG 7141]